MPPRIILASGSQIRQTLLRNAGVPFQPMPVKIDEAALRDGLLAQGAKPVAIADQLAEQKARSAATRQPDAIVIGCDQVLDFDGELLSKARDRDEQRAILDRLNGQSHRLLSAVVIYEAGQPVWRHVGKVELHMRQSSDVFMESYITRNWPGIAEAVGGYKLEEEGVRLFHRVEGDYFTVLGLPLLDLLAYLSQKGLIPG
ncbi:MAG: septum formation protein Maf [Rhodobacteraceae bacterium]|nr:septum formation protein Maf [Paracoccaceae bacterium]